MGARGPKPEYTRQSLFPFGRHLAARVQGRQDFAPFDRL